MRILDKGAGFDLKIHKDAAAFESTEAMFAASSRLERRAAASALTGLATITIGAVVSVKTRRHEHVSMLSRGIVLGGAFRVLQAVSEWVTYDDLQHGAGMIEWKVAEGTAEIMPEA